MKTVLDPNSGKISTVLTAQNTPPTIISPSSPVKKLSYLNLACCVNGYSNITTYNSKFRQNINKSREVSPIRPITHTVQYNRSGDNKYLSIPAPIPINDNTKSHMMDAHTILSPEKRYFSTQTKQSPLELNGSARDCTDNINTNGCTAYFKNTSSVTSNFNSLGNNRDANQDYDSSAKTTTKSFIQQRVERLYGPNAQLYSPKKPKSSDENLTTLAKATSTTFTSILVEKSQNSSNTFQSTKYVLEAQRNGHLNQSRPHNEENFNMDSLNDALPVLRHLRPEFRAQLPTLSPKRTVAISRLNTTSIPSTGQYANGTAAEKINDYLDCSAKSVNSVNPLPQSQQQQTTNGDNRYTQNNTQCQMTTQTSKQSVCNKIFNASTSNAQIIDAVATTNSGITSKVNFDIENDCRHSSVAEKPIEIINSLNQLHLNDTNTINIESETNGHMTNKLNAQLESKDKSINSEITEINSKDIDTNTIEPTMNTSKQNSTAENAIDANGNHKSEPIKDALHYLTTVHSERDRLLDLAVAAEKELDELMQVNESIS